MIDLDLVPTPVAWTTCLEIQETNAGDIFPAICCESRGHTTPHRSKWWQSYEQVSWPNEGAA
ncbi:hypothetical protein GCM10028801_30560 [Nocardioides maradonensis]